MSFNWSVNKILSSTHDKQLIQQILNVTNNLSYIELWNYPKAWKLYLIFPCNSVIKQIKDRKR